MSSQNWPSSRPRHAGSAWADGHRVVSQQVLAGNFEPGFKAALAHKDLGLAQNMAARLGVPLFSLAPARQLYSIAVAEGKGERSMGVIAPVLERLAGISLSRR